MLSSLSRIFQPSPASNSDRSRLPETGADARVDDRLNENGLRLSLGTQHSDSAPLLARHHTSHVSLHSGMDSPRPGPSHVSWKTPQPNSQQQSGRESPASVHAQPMWGTHLQAQPYSMSHSASSPSLLVSPLSTASASQAYRPSSVGKRSSLSVGFAADSAYASEDSDGDSVRSTRSHNVPKQLSPIHETHHFPPQRKKSLESAPRTPDSARTFDRIGGHSPAHSAFINRPLKRSISQTSASTFRSNASIAPPSIPPLDLRPDFQNAMGVPHGSPSPALASAPRKSRLAGPTLPTVIGSPIQTNKVSVIYEDGASARTSSFITAPSLNSPVAEVDPPIFVARDYAASSATDGTDTEETDATQRPGQTHHPLPEGLFDVDLNDTELGLRPTSRRSLRPSTASDSLMTPRRSTETRPTYSRSTSSASVSESFLNKRWFKDKSFGSDRFVLPPSAQKRGRIKASYACILFWVGFVAPWCWLIGGWLLTTTGEVASDGLAAETGPVLPLWHRRRKGGAQGPRETTKGKRRADAGVPMPEKVKAINGAAERRIKAKSWYPLLAPSLESLAPSSTGSAMSTRKLKRCLPRSSTVDPWIRRCRVAAAASGVLIFAAFVVAIILVAGVRM
ncbi:hypothetical protein BV20DRAFT_964071 [Pilatotrama ljubarskyi]|nr:hypothetical protein BV20DRAFT_964071 [Pilatotrama ljubarskyi]